MVKKIEWKVSKTPIEYDHAINIMQKRVLKIKKDLESELVWMLEHKSIFTAGTSAKIEHLINSNIEYKHTGRGGQWTWHGPGQRVVYFLLNLKERNPDIRWFINNLEEIAILTLKDFSINGVRIKDRPGVWVKNKNNYDKIVSLGIRISSWITFHGISINIMPNLEEFNKIVPCGIIDGGVTSFYKLNKIVTYNQVDESLKKNFYKVFL